MQPCPFIDVTMVPEVLDDVVSKAPYRLDDLVGSSGVRRAFSQSARADDAAIIDRAPSWRQTPRVSLIVVLPEGHEMPPAELADRWSAHGDDPGDVIVACAGRPANLATLQRCVGNAQYLFAPAGTSAEELRELAIQQASGDIVTLVSGALMSAVSVEEERKSC